MKEFWKRIFDICISVLAIMMLLPVFAVIIIAIRVSSKGAAVFKQERAGKDGKPFAFYKLCTKKLYVNHSGQLRQPMMI